VITLRFTKVSDDTHRLEIVRADGRREALTCETRSLLTHDLLHYAVEAEAGLESGFWGLLAKGKTLGDMNDRTGRSMSREAPALLAIEQLVGALTSVTKGRASADIVAAITTYMESQRPDGDAPRHLPPGMPPWLTVAFVDAVRERMRALHGHWKATPYGGTMELAWPAGR
jgi:hypothetical protein